MNLTKRAFLALSAAMVTTAAAGTVQAQSLTADTVVSVSLWDNGDSSMDELGNMPPLAFGMKPDMTKATMGVKVSQTTMKAGVITFEAVNDSKSFIHEMIVSPVPTDAKPLVYLQDENKVDEEASGHLGEVSELDPGAIGALTLVLKPGKYLLYCNIPGHYVMGMWTEIEVQ